MIKDSITARYARETGTAGLGCANLQPFLTIAGGDIVLDLGCGNGHNTVQLAALVGESGFVYGIDITRDMIEKAQKQHNRANVQFILADMHYIPISDNTVNVVLSNCVINHSVAKEEVFGEIYRILQPGGHFLISDVMSVGRLPEEVRSNPQNIAACWGGAIPKDEYLALIQATGFINVRELSSRQYYKNNFLLESIIVKGEKT